ncbi:Phenylalanine--tRNA ligase beta subunit [Polystyrenella longa]|uniref:Phenylalanine--tRNA ligase beta subunit n=1 Tax=Polystyrenella longa TaxID=2528007 RepID=A0A518CPJ5_9PLAN|nr:phenylalanine--tRNA ligase subunit beta [Polystyrenella longa]QDU81141.1 Phenylalanine--tRNA ligase beta subunit [Polystyrenella longa]
MIASWDWLTEYVSLDMSLDNLTDRLTISGLNLEGIEEVGGETAIDLEVTSNRADCLGHIGIAREVACLFDKKLTIPAAEPTATGDAVDEVTSVTIDCPELCPRYVARVIRNVKVGPSPDWLQKRLATLGIASINNVVDITNYVLMECGQPLHAFDFDKLSGQKIVVRKATKGEKITAIDQREYELDAEMCVIADVDRPVAIAGVMGGLDTEISAGTTNILIEVANFTPLTVRSTARKLSLHSDSSFRFERYIDVHQMDWASRRCCDLILQIAGGELLEGSIDVGEQPTEKTEQVTLRFSQIKRLLGIDIDPKTAVEILTVLGLKQVGKTTKTDATFIAPTWRRDLTREVDLIEEVARIYGYDQIPEDRFLPVHLTTPTEKDQTTRQLYKVLNGLGFSEAYTVSFVSREDHELFQPFGELEPLHVEHSTRKKENLLRQSLIPSLLRSRRENERHNVFNAELFEIAKVYVKAKPGAPEQEVEPMRLSMVSGRSFLELKGAIETIANRINDGLVMEAKPADIGQFEPGRGAELSLDGKPFGWIGEISRDVQDKLSLRDTVCVAELDLATLIDIRKQIKHATELPQFPNITRDFNFVMNESVEWNDLETTVRSAGGKLLENIQYGGMFRGKQLGADLKSYLMHVSFRSSERTLTSEEVDAAHADIVAACEKKLNVNLR